MARTILEFDYNRNRGVKMTPLEVSFLTGDKNGHEFHIRLTDDDGDVDLSGAKVKGFLIPDDQGRDDDVTVPMEGSTQGNVAMLTLCEECYLKTGRFSLVIKAGNGDDLGTIFWATGSMLRSSTDTLYDSGKEVSLATLLAKIEAAEEKIPQIETTANAAKAEIESARGEYDTLDDRLTEIENSSGAHRYGILWDKSNAACMRLYDAEGMVANAYKGSYNANLVNDFDDRYPWSGRRVCNVDLDEYRRIKAADGDIRGAIIAWDGDADFALDGSNGFVGVYTPEFWVRQEETSDGVIVVVADQELPGYVHFPFTIGGRYFGSSDGNGGMTSKAGAVPLSANMEGTNYTLGTLHTLAKNGEMTLDDVYTWAADTILLAVEFATMNSQAAIGDGVSSLYRQNAADLPLAAGSGNSVIVPVACANVAIPGALIDFATSTGHAQTARRVVTAVNAYAADSNYKEIVFDGAPVTYTAATIVQIHGLTNTADAQVGSKSGYIGTNGKSHAYYRGRVAHANMFRYILGAYRQTGTGRMWYAKDREQAAAYDALNTDEHVDSGYSLPYKEDGTNAEGYVKSLGLVKKLPLFPFCTEVGGSSSNPVGDYCWHPAKTSGNTVAVCGGDANNGACCGRGFASWHYSSGHSGWHCAALPFLI